MILFIYTHRDQLIHKQNAAQASLIIHFDYINNCIDYKVMYASRQLREKIKLNKLILTL